MIDPDKLIKTPCCEDWNEMTGDEKSRHCKKCDTQVVDLTGMSAAEIKALKESKGGRLCGMFRLGSSLAKPIAVSTGVASLALAACSQPDEHILGGIRPPVGYPEEGQIDHAKPESGSRHAAKPFTDGPKLKPTSGQQPAEPFLLGIVCEPPKKRL